MPNRWDSKWDHFCFVRASSPSLRGWLWFAAALVAVVGIAAAVAKYWLS